jgi:hypothetical protein
MAVKGHATHLLAGDSWIALSDGVKHVRDLRSGDVAILVRPDGKLDNVRIKAAVLDDPQGPCASLLVAVGEILLPKTSRIVTRAGAARADELAAVVRAGGAVRVEVIRPADAFAEGEPYGSKKSAYQAALTAFPRPSIMIPGWLDKDSRVGVQIEEVFATAEVTYKRLRTDDWLIYSFHRPRTPEPFLLWAKPEDQAYALRLITAWSIEDGEMVSRILFDEVVLLQRLTGCLAAARQEFEVKWIPAYKPVEVRVVCRNDFLRSHVPVIRAVTRYRSHFRVSVEGPGALVLGLALAS